jgi:hypothetical protein
MLKILLAATMAFGLMPGVVFAQSSPSSNSTTVTTPTQQDDTTSTTKRTATGNGVLIEKDTSGTEISSPGTPATTQTSTQATTTHQ